MMYLISCEQPRELLVARREGRFIYFVEIFLGVGIAS